MTDHDESLEISIDGGLDIPTAMVISEHDDNGGPRWGSGCGVAAMVIPLILLGLTQWLGSVLQAWPPGVCRHWMPGSRS
jgi:hypothetical protein